MTPVDSMRVDDANDTEITLGTGKMLAIFFGLVILCAVFFGMGFSMGRNSVRSAPELLPSPARLGIRDPRRARINRLTRHQQAPNRSPRNRPPILVRRTVRVRPQ